MTIAKLLVYYCAATLLRNRKVLPKTVNVRLTLRQLDDLLDRFDTFDPDKFLVEAPVEIREPVGVEAHLLQDRRV